MVAKRALSALSKIGIIIAIAVAFMFGLAGTVYLSLRSPEVKVPDIKGKDRMTAEAALDEMGLHMKVRATRFSPDAKPDTVIDQLPQKDDVIKVGQTVAVVVARGPKEGESPTTTTTNSNTQEKKPETENAAGNQNTRDAWITSADNENQNKPKANKNANNRNSINSNNSNSLNRNANNRNAANGNTNNRNVNTASGNTDRSADNVNANKRPPVTTTPPFVPSRPPGTP